MLSPVANRLRRWGLPRGAAAAISVLGGLVLIVGALTLIGTQIAAQASTLSTNVVTGFNQLLDWLRNGPLPISESWLNSTSGSNRIQEFLVDSQSTIADVRRGDRHPGRPLPGRLRDRPVRPVLLPVRRPRHLDVPAELLPARRPGAGRRGGPQGWRSLSRYVRATILVALVDAVGVLIVALILGVPLAPALAALVFIGAFIPLVGAFVSGFVAVVVALVALGWVQALIMLAGIIVVMQIEGHVLQPFLLGRAVKLHPLAVLLGDRRRHHRRRHRRRADGGPAAGLHQVVHPVPGRGHRPAEARLRWRRAIAAPEP